MSAKKKRRRSAKRGACAAADQRWGMSAKAANRDCKADAPDRSAFGEKGGKASAAAREHSGPKLVAGRLVR